MEKLSRQAVESLMNSRAKPAVTIYIPMHTTASPPHISENQIRFKNLLHKAAEELSKQSAHGKIHDLAQRLQHTIEEIRNNLSFWENQSPGLLICANSDFLRMYHLPIDTEEYVAIDEQFHLAPVLGLLEDAKEFYLLTLAQHNPTLHKGDLYGLQATNVSLPVNIRKGLGIDENNQKTESQGSANGSSTRTGWFNGRGGARNPQEEDRLRFFRIIDNRLTNKADRNLPLLLAGVDSEVAEYRSLSHYPKLMSSHLSGNFTEVDSKELSSKASAIMRRDVVEPEHAAAIEEFNRLQGANPERVASDRKSIMAAAEQGRVDKLLAAMYHTTSDTVRDTLSAMLRITFPDKSTSKVLNQLALTVWSMRGTVMCVLPEQLPSNQPMVARLRY